MTLGNGHYGKTVVDGDVTSIANLELHRVVTVLMGISSLVFYVLGARVPIVCSQAIVMILQDKQLTSVWLE